MSCLSDGKWKTKALNSTGNLEERISTDQGGQSVECEKTNYVHMLEMSACVGQQSNPLEAESPDAADALCFPLESGECNDVNPDPDDMSKHEYINHLLTHLPKIPNCGIGNEGKMRQRPARRRLHALPREPMEWGDVQLADLLTVGSKNADLALGVKRAL